MCVVFESEVWQGLVGVVLVRESQRCGIDADPVLACVTPGLAPMMSSCLQNTSMAPLLSSVLPVPVPHPGHSPPLSSAPPPHTH